MKIKFFFTVFCCLIFACLACFAFEWQTGEKVSFQTPDGVIISGLFHKPASGAHKTYILLHGLGSGQDEWQSLSDKLVSAGCGVLSYDARGHGRSTMTAGGRKISYTEFGPPGPGSQWDKMPADLGLAIAFLNDQKNIPTNRIGLIGASIGANICLIYAAKAPVIPVVVLLSPGLNYAGFGTMSSIGAFTKRPILFAASPTDTYAYQSSILLYQKVQANPKAAFLTGASGHGVQMFDGKFDKQLLKWILSH